MSLRVRLAPNDPARASHGKEGSLRRMWRAMRMRESQQGEDLME